MAHLGRAAHAPVKPVRTGADAPIDHVSSRGRIPVIEAIVPRLGVVGALILVSTLFHLWDGKTIRAREWIRHGEEYVITLEDGSTLILRQREVREVSPQDAGSAPAPGPQPPPPSSRDPRTTPGR